MSTIDKFKQIETKLDEIEEIFKEINSRSRSYTPYADLQRSVRYVKAKVKGIISVRESRLMDGNPD